jgi:hypothetical protein
MFRKISATSKRPKAVRKRTIDDDDEDDEYADDVKEQQGNPTGDTLDAEGSVSAIVAPTMTTQQQIQYTKKKRKLLTTLQYKKGLDTNQLLQVVKVKQTNHNANNSSDNADAESDADDVEPTPADPLTTSAQASAAAEQGSQEGVLESKHKQAMESYIQQKMKLGAANAKEAANWNSNNNEGDDNDMGLDNKEKEIRQHATTLTKEQLYRELAVAAARLAGKTDNEDNNGNDNKKNNASDSTKDGDVGAGGAMLVAGTGIAEVILPVDERLKTHKDTNESIQSRNQLKGKNKNAAAAAKSRNTSSTATGSSRPSAVPNRFFVPNTMQSFPQSRDAPATGAATTTATTTSPFQQTSAAATGTANAVDDDRVGFDAVKRQRDGSAAGASSSSTSKPTGQRTNQQGPQQQSSTSSSNQQQQRNSKSSDDRVFRKFVSRQRDAQMRDKK